MGRPDWTAIEEDCIKSGLSYTQLADKYGVSLAALKKQASRKGWGRKLTGTAKKAKRVETALLKMSPAEMSPETEMSPKNVTAGDIVYDRETDAQRFQRIVDGMLDRVEEAICKIDPNDAGSIKLLTGALKDLRDLKHLNRTELDIEEQKARIEKLKNDARVVEEGEESGVILMPAIEEVQPPDE